jgi:hypothetical protein
VASAFGAFGWAAMNCSTGVGLAVPGPLLVIATRSRQVYNGVNAFILVDAAGKRTPFRYRIVPVAGEEMARRAGISSTR